MKTLRFTNILKKSAKSSRFFLTLLALLFSFNSFGQSDRPQEYDSLSLFSNALFWTMLGVIVLLLIFIVVLSDALKHVASVTKDQSSEGKNTGKIMTIVALIALSFSAKTSHAQSFFAISKSPDSYGGLSSGLFFFMIAVIVFELVVVFALINYIKYLAKIDKKEKIAVAIEQPSLLERLNASVSIEKEEDILLDHNYDGIRELDNDLPPWWKYGFYATIVFAFIYLVHYHVTATGDLQIAEYNKSVLVAKIAKEEFEKNNANNVNESNVAMLTDKTQIADGEKIFKETCFACHGKFGEGGVGPNLTDDYWLHGGSIKDIFSTIKYGWPDKGMKSWQADLSPVQIHEIASYIKTIHGSNPANGKAPQGDLFTEIKSVSDSTKNDSISAPVVQQDSMKVKNN